MIWILAVHIMALLVWCASLLFLQSLLAGARQDPGSHRYESEMPHVVKRHESVARFLFTTVVTPAALLAIMAGTWVFLLSFTTNLWLIAKLTLVTALVVCHALTGLILLRAEAGSGVRGWCWLLITVSVALMLLIVWLVLAKPDAEALLWFD